MFEKRNVKFRFSSFNLIIFSWIIIFCFSLFQLFYFIFSPSKTLFSINIFLSVIQNNVLLQFFTYFGLISFILISVYQIIYFSIQIKNQIILKNNLKNVLLILIVFVFYFFVPNLIAINFATLILLVFYSIMYDIVIS